MTEAARFMKEDQRDMVEMLEEILAQARAGDIGILMVAGNESDGSEFCGWSWKDGQNPIRALGSMTQLRIMVESRIGKLIEEWNDE